ncbi:MAG: hypothetical protein M1274_05270 [Actinobacteria bacterium]|nr:hypothetical protein [Actinomycetota bacterium]
MGQELQSAHLAVRAIAGVASLPLEQEREGLVADALSPWVAGANGLSQKMSQQQYAGVVPITVFAHK